MENISNKLVSIIIPTYNNQNTICRAIDSCLNQIYQNIEIIVIDDGSTDNTKDILKKYNNDSRFNYYYQENQERSTARNHGLDLAKGEYIQFLDSDDTLYSEKLEKQVNFLNKNQNYFLVYCGVEYKNKENRTTHTLEPKIEGHVEYQILKGNFLVIHSPLFRKIDIRFDVNLNRLEDWKFWIYVTKQKYIGYIDEVLCDVYIEKQNSKEYILKMLKGDIFIYTELINNQLFKDMRYFIYFLKFKKYLQYFYHSLKSGN